MALAVAMGGDCLADVDLLRAKPAVFGPVASDPTVSQLFDTLAAGGKRALTALRQARAQVCEYVWTLVGEAAPDASGHVVVDLDGVLVIAHSEKRGRDLEEDLRAPSADGVRRPRPGRVR